MAVDQEEAVPKVRMFDDSLYRKGGEACEQPDTQNFAFGKLFPDLPGFADGQDPADVVGRLRELGKKGGRMDAADPPVTLASPLDADLACDPADRGEPCDPDNDNPDMTVGFTFLGQFLDRDVTLDRRPLNSTTPAPNRRTPFFDLNSVYGQGAVDGPSLRDRTRPDRLELDLAFPQDLPRGPGRTVRVMAEGGIDSATSRDRVLARDVPCNRRRRRVGR